MILKRVLWLILSCGLLSACTGAIYHSEQVPDKASRVISVDARQRAILSNMGWTKFPNGAAPIRRFCSEPSPDVFTVVAQALSAGGSFGQSADPKSIEVALNLAFSSSEQGTTIPRTQTINMLRELMFRTCERYLDGGYDEGQLSIQAIRDQRLMVSILAIEQLTGAVTPRPVVIGASGSAGAGVTGDAIVRLDDARKAKDKADLAYNAAVADYEALNKDDACTKLAAKPEGELSEDEQKDLKACQEAETGKNEALAERTKRTAAYTELSQLARGGGVSVITSLSHDAPGGLDTARKESIASVAGAVAEIVRRNFDDNSEVMMFCIDYFKRSEGNLVDTCREFLKSTILAARDSVVEEASTNRLANLLQSQDIIKNEADKNFFLFWSADREKSFASQTEREAFIVRLKTRLPRKDAAKADCFAKADNRVDAKACFNALTLPQQRELIK